MSKPYVIESAQHCNKVLILVYAPQETVSDGQTLFTGAAVVYQARFSAAKVLVFVGRPTTVGGIIRIRWVQGAAVVVDDPPFGGEHGVETSVFAGLYFNSLACTLIQRIHFRRYLQCIA